MFVTNSENGCLFQKVRDTPQTSRLVFPNHLQIMKNELWCKVGFSCICPKTTSFKLHKMAPLLLFRNMSNTFIFFLAMSFKISWIFITFPLGLHLSSFKKLFRIKQSQTWPKLKKTV